MTNYRILRVVLLLLLGSLLVTKSVALEVVGSVGGACPSVAAKDGYVYLCEGRGLTVLDARAAGDPVVIDRVRLDAGTTCVRLDNDVAYMGTLDKKVRLYSLANPASPSLLSTITLIGGSLADAAFEGGHAFFANEGGVEIVNVSDLEAPVAVSRYVLPEYSYPMDKRHVGVRGGKMYVSNRLVCDAVNVSIPEQPRYLIGIDPAPSHLGFPPAGVAAVRISGDHLYIMWRGYYRADSFIYRRDVTAALYSLDSSGYPQLLASSYVSEDADDVLFSEDRKIAFALDGWERLAVMYDISDPAAFRRIGRTKIAGPVNEGALDGSSLLAASPRGLTKFEVEPNNGPAITGQYVAINWPNTFASVLGNAGGLLIAGTGDAMAAIDADDASSPKLLRTIECRDRLVSMAAFGRYLYFSDELAGLDLRYLALDGTMARIDTLNLLSEEGIGYVHYGEVIVQGRTAWLAFLTGDHADGTAGLVGLDVSNPLRPVVLGVSSIRADFSTTTVGNPLLALSGNRACVAADKLYFFDIADPTSPFFLSDLRVSPDYHHSRVYWFDDSLFHIGGVVNTSDATNPVLHPISSPVPPWSTLRWVENGRAYVAGYQDLTIYRIAPDGELVLLESFTSRVRIDDVETYGGYVYAMDWNDGLLVMKTNFPDHRAQRHLLGSDTGAADQNGDGAIDAADLVLAMEAARE